MSPEVYNIDTLKTKISHKLRVYGKTFNPDSSRSVIHIHKMYDKLISASSEEAAVACGRASRAFVFAYLSYLRLSSTGKAKRY